MTKRHTTAGYLLENIVIMKCLKKKDVQCIGNRLLQIDLIIMETFIAKEMDSTEIEPTFIFQECFTLWAFRKRKLAHLPFNP